MHAEPHTSAHASAINTISYTSKAPSEYCFFYVCFVSNSALKNNYSCRRCWPTGTHYDRDHLSCCPVHDIRHIGTPSYVGCGSTPWKLCVCVAFYLRMTFWCNVLQSPTPRPTPSPTPVRPLQNIACRISLLHILADVWSKYWCSE